MTALALTYALLLNALGVWLVFAWLAPWGRRAPKK